MWRDIIIISIVLLVFVIASVLTFTVKKPQIALYLCYMLTFFWLLSVFSWAERVKLSPLPRVSWYLAFFMLFYGSMTYLFSLMYYNAAALESKLTRAESFIDYFYYSIITVTTLGYGDILPTDNRMKILSIVEVSFGVIFLAAVLTVVLAFRTSTQSEQ